MISALLRQDNSCSTLSDKIARRTPGSFSVVDARDVAEHQIAAINRGRSGERYLAAGNHMDMKSIFQALSSVSGIKAPERKVPLFMLRIIALIYEGYYRITKSRCSSVRPRSSSWSKNKAAHISAITKVQGSWSASSAQLLKH